MDSILDNSCILSAVSVLILRTDKNDTLPSIPFNYLYKVALQFVVVHKYSFVWSFGSFWTKCGFVMLCQSSPYYFLGRNWVLTVKQ